MHLRLGKHISINLFPIIGGALALILPLSFISNLLIQYGLDVNIFNIWGVEKAILVLNKKRIMIGAK
jgi:hypothetical protein